MHLVSVPPRVDGVDEDGEGLDPWGAVIVGELKPVAYIYELETGVWHWMGEFVEERTGAECEILYAHELFQDVVRAKCGSYFRQPPEDVLEVYASVTPKSEQLMCKACGFKEITDVPTLSRGGKRMVP